MEYDPELVSVRRRPSPGLVPLCIVWPNVGWPDHHPDNRWRFRGTTRISGRVIRRTSRSVSIERPPDRRRRAQRRKGPWTRWLPPNGRVRPLWSKSHGTRKVRKARKKSPTA